MLSQYQSGAQTRRVAALNEAEQKMDEAIKSVQEAQAMYENAMSLDSADLDPKVNFELALRREQELEIQVEAEANQYIPFSLDEVSLDFCVIGPSASSAGGGWWTVAQARVSSFQPHGDNTAQSPASPDEGKEQRRGCGSSRIAMRLG